MSIEFNGSTDLMTYPLSATAALNDALTLLAVIKILNTSDNTWMSYLEFERSGGTQIAGAMGRRPSGGSIGEIYYVNTAGVISGGSIEDADGWMIVAVTRSAAAATNVHKLPIGGSRTTNTLGALADGLSIANGVMKLGGDDDPANIRVAAVAYWDGTELTTTQLDGILAAKSTSSINALTPTSLYDASDSLVNDLIGGRNRTSVSGTTSSGDNPAGWAYGLGGPPPTNVTPPAISGSTVAPSLLTSTPGTWDG